MNKVRKVVEYRRKPDGTYECVDPEPMKPCPSKNSKSKRLRKLSAYGNTVFMVMDGKNWAELRLMPAGTYSVCGEQIAVTET